VSVDEGQYSDGGVLKASQHFDLASKTFVTVTFERMKDFDRVWGPLGGLRDPHFPTAAAT
jgi:hypothetical protein